MQFTNINRLKILNKMNQPKKVQAEVQKIFKMIRIRFKKDNLQINNQNLMKKLMIK